jgi:hypothetical protein
VKKKNAGVKRVKYELELLAEKNKFLAGLKSK